MPTQDQLDDYFSRSGDTELSVGNMEENEYGFCVWRENNGNLLLIHVYGDGKFWNNWAANKAKELGMNKVCFATKRNPMAFCRKHGFELEGYILARSI
jgi:hypothetical protein